jgi:hypothetical protein
VEGELGVPDEEEEVVPSRGRGQCLRREEEGTQGSSPEFIHLQPF